MNSQVSLSFWMAGIAVGLLASPVKAEEKRVEFSSLNSQFVNSTQPSTPSVSKVQDLQRPATTVKDWMAQIEAATVQVTGVQLNPTDTGLEIVLQTAEGKPLQVDATKFRTEGNSLVADIPNAVLTLADPPAFNAEAPTADVSRVQVSQTDAKTIQVVVTGNNALPQQEVTLKTGEFAYSLNPEGDEPDEEVVVTGEGQRGYFVPNASTANRTDTPLRDTPQSIQVIPRQVIEDQQAISVEEVLQNAAGVTSLGNQDGRGFNFAIRGFDFAPVLRDGFNFSLFGTDVAEPEVANLERIEVLRGPASVLYGQAEPGGVINLVTKQPLSKPYYNLQFQAGNRNFISPSIDLSGPLTTDGRLLYRFNALYRQEDSFRNFENNLTRFFIAPTLTWLISDRTNLTINLEYTKDDEPADFGTIAFGRGIADIPLERVVNTNPDSTIEQESLYVGYTLQHRFSDNWQLRNQFRYTTGDYSYSVLPIPMRLNESTGILNRAFAFQSNEADAYALYTNIQGKFNTGSVKHTLLFGVDLARARNEGATRFGIAFPTPINIFNPNYSAVPTPQREQLPIFFGSSQTVNYLGIYLQDQIKILDNLILVAGLRYDTVDSAITDILTRLETNQYDDAFTPRIGIVYQPIKPISLYANYSRSFAPNFFATDAQGQPLKPEAGKGFEIGVKAELVENRLAATLAYFDITKQNVATADPNDPFASIAVGEEQSRGVDFNLSGEILPGWNIVASYAYIDAKVTQDNTSILGNRLRGVPEHSASLWTTYQIQSGDLQGFGFGLGFNFVGARAGDIANSFDVDSYFLTNAAIFYKRNNWQVRLNFDNIFDIDYIRAVGNNRIRGIYPGDPFTVRASVSVTF